MKLKAVVQNGCPPELVEALQNAAFRERVVELVLQCHLRAKGFGPAEFYVQNCDFAFGEPMCEARLTGVSVNTRRATDDFRSALSELEQIYRQTIVPFIKKGERYQLFVSMMLDRPPLGESSSLLERDPVYLEAAPVIHRDGSD